MIGALVTLIVFCVIAGLIYYLLGLLPLPEPFKQIVIIAFICICIVVLLGWLFGGIELPRMRTL